MIDLYSSWNLIGFKVKWVHFAHGRLCCSEINHSRVVSHQHIHTHTRIYLYICLDMHIHIQRSNTPFLVQSFTMIPAPPPPPNAFAKRCPAFDARMANKLSHYWLFLHKLPINTYPPLAQAQLTHTHTHPHTFY